jgi:hypothetical protein
MNSSNKNGAPNPDLAADRQFLLQMPISQAPGFAISDIASGRIEITQPFRHEDQAGGRMSDPKTIDQTVRGDRALLRPDVRQRCSAFR